jgi:indole-3-glycerol phosphate synthase
MSILQKIIAHKKKEIALRKKIIPLDELLTQLPFRLAAPRFAKALKGRGVRLIAEVKKASPSQGVIRKNFRHVDIARAYQTGGAAALSVLTDERFFKGRLSYLDDIRKSVSLPILRKDFIIDPYQVVETKAHRADALLLIAACLTSKQLQGLLSLATRYKLDALVEVHDKKELQRAIAAGACLIGINSRNLKDFSVDLERAAKLIRFVPRGCLTVLESGVKSPSDLCRVKESGANAVLVGEALMRAPGVLAATRAFTKALR